MISQMDTETLSQVFGRAAQTEAQVPPESQDMAAAILTPVQQRMEAVGGGR